MVKSRLRQEQDLPMDVYTVRLTAAHARIARKIGGGVLADGIRGLIEAGKFNERRIGPVDRRKKKKRVA